MNAKRGDVVVIESTTSYTYTDRTERVVQFELGIVTGITREGMVRTYSHIGWGDAKQELSRKVGLVRWYIVPKSDNDVAGIVETVKAHHYDGHPNQVKPFSSLDEVKAALASHRLQIAA